MVASAAAAHEGLSPHAVTILLNLTKEVTAVTSGVNALLAERAAAAESRRVLHERVNDVVDRVSDVASACERHNVTLTRIVPMVETAETKRQQRAGAAALKKKQMIAVKTGIGVAAGVIPWLTARLTFIGDWLPPTLAKFLLIRS